MSFTKSDLAISTMWNFRKAHSGEELIDQLTALGFSRVELNYQVRAEWLSGIRRRIDEGAIKVSSVHNVFPKTLDKKFDTDSIMLGYEDESLRQQAVELAKGSVEWACVLGAGAVVFHPTEVPMSPDAFDVPLKALNKAHQTDTPEYKALHARMIAARQAQPYLDRMMKSIDELATYVTKYNLPVKLGMENRAMCHQCPIYSEFDMIADRFAGGPVGIWLDTGHAIMMEEMGLQQLPLSKKVADMIVACTSTTRWTRWITTRLARCPATCSRPTGSISSIRRSRCWSCPADCRRRRSSPEPTALWKGTGNEQAHDRTRAS